MIFNILLVVEWSASLLLALRLVRSWQHVTESPGWTGPARDWGAVIRGYVGPSVPKIPWRKPEVSARPERERPVSKEGIPRTGKGRIRLRSRKLRSGGGWFLPPREIPQPPGNGDLPKKRRQGPRSSPDSH